MIQSIYWTYSWSCKQLKRSDQSFAPSSNYYITFLETLFFTLPRFWEMRRGGVRKNYIQEKKRKKKLACCFNCELRNCPLWENKETISDQNIPFTFSTVTGFPPLSTLCVYYPQLLKVMLEIHNMSRCCCQSFAVYFLSPQEEEIYI